MIRRVIKIALPLLAASIKVAASADLTGRASVIDGDTLEIHGTRVRIWGIDAPESSQLCRGADIGAAPRRPTNSLRSSADVRCRACP